MVESATSPIRWQWRRALCALMAGVVFLSAGCSRSFYRSRADCDAYGIVAEKSLHTPWAPPVGFQILPNPVSRLFDPSPIDDPDLPIVAPRLYEYEIPELRPSQQRSPSGPILSLPPEPAPLQPEVIPPIKNESSSRGKLRNLATPLIQTVGYQSLGQEQSPDRGANAPDIDTSPVTIPNTAWDSIPRSALMRVLGFQRLRNEYARTFGQPPSGTELDSSRALSLEEIVELALLNSREYQSQKERLYRAALRLTLSRYQFDLKPSADFGANRAALDYRHTRATGIGTVNTLSLPSNLQADKVLRTGGDLLARLANNIVLTFNGPEGFASDLNSQLFVEVTQTVFQRDIRFESLTQAERNVVYAARDFARFRKVLFNQLCEQYYELIRTYRQIEIDSLNYFTLVRAMTQRGEEFRVGLVSRVQVDQIEQNSLAGLINLIGTSNRLESDLDRLKLRIGLPTETRINLDLTELEKLTTADEVAVAGQLVQRVRKRLQQAASRDALDPTELLNLCIDLLVRMQEFFSLSQDLGTETVDLKNEKLVAKQTQLQLAQARMAVRTQRSLLDSDKADPMATRMRLVQRHLQLIDAILGLLNQQQRFGRQLGLPSPVAEEIAETRRQLSERFQQVETVFEKALEDLQVQQIEAALRTSEQILADAENAVRAANRALGIAADDPADAELQKTMAEVHQVLDQSRELLERLGGGLVPVEISVDDAMLTALVLRMDLMNQRGFLADNWRQIKLASDDLKSILNLSASQRLEDFRFEDSETRLQVTFDAPLNRRAQRNQFRESLIDYQAARRELMESEDLIKFAIRNDLRDLNLSKQQYDLGVASAALAFERVIGTRLQLQMGVAGIQARDFLEAQTAYALSLSTVALRHIGYIRTRTQFFLDLELLDVDQGGGFWPGLRDDKLQPTPIFTPPAAATLPFGDLPPDVHYSNEMRRMLGVPFGEPAIYGAESR